MNYEIDIRGKYCAVVEVNDKASLKWVVETAQVRLDVSLIRVIRNSGCRQTVRTLAYENDRWVGDLGDFL